MRFRAYAIPDAESERSGAIIEQWLERWKADVANFSDDGCGCCVHILEFDASDEAIKDLEANSGWILDRHPEGKRVGGEHPGNSKHRT